MAMDKSIQELMQFSKTMLSITDTTDIVSFLNKEGCEFFSVDKINLITYSHKRSEINLYYLNKIGIVKRDIIDKDSVYYNYYLNDSFLIMETDYYENHPNNRDHDAYLNVKSYVRSPLTTISGSIGMLEFINVDLNHRHSFSLLTSMLSAYVSHILEHEVSTLSAVFERQQQEHLLVDVTNAVISQSTVESLLRSLIDCLNTHFPIQEISIVNHTTQMGYTQYCYSQFSGVDYVQNLFKPSDNFATSLEKDNVVVFKGEELIALKENSPLFKISESIQIMVLVPLIFRNVKHGFLLYSIEQNSKQPPLELELLQQISARVALAMHSLLKHKEDKKNHPVSEFIEVEETYQHYLIFDDIISQSETMNQMLEQVAMVADCDSTVLIFGETGTGKELIAQAIHKMSSRRHKSMVKMNCAAVPTGLFESELFGHERGAFTGAVKQRVGRFEQANNSTLFLDEIGEMPLELQPKLLRVLQESEIERVGKNQLIPVDVRIIVATNVDLLEMVQKKTFRSDLFYRLNIFPIEVPPLRERNEDIPLLIKHFTRVLSKKMGKTITKINYRDMDVLTQFDWPGNVRQLRNFIERCVILTRGDVLCVPLDDLFKMGLTVPMESFFPPSLENKTKATTKGLSKEEILESLRVCNGIVAGDRGAAKRLGLKRTTLLSRMQKMGITSSDYLSDAGI
ncbi:sigma-54 interaction domain-containing protein [Vibrio mediterranei]